MGRKGWMFHVEENMWRKDHQWSIWGWGEDGAWNKESGQVLIRKICDLQGVYSVFCRWQGAVTECLGVERHRECNISGKHVIVCGVWVKQKLEVKVRGRFESHLAAEWTGWVTVWKVWTVAPSFCFEWPSRWLCHLLRYRCRRSRDGNKLTNSIYFIKKFFIFNFFGYTGYLVAASRLSLSAYGI